MNVVLAAMDLVTLTLSKHIFGDRLDSRRTSSSCIRRNSETKIFWKLAKKKVSKNLRCRPSNGQDVHTACQSQFNLVVVLMARNIRS